MSLPSTPSSSEGAVQSLPTPLIPHLLFPDRDVGAIVAGVRFVGREGRAVEDEGGLVCL